MNGEIVRTILETHLENTDFIEQITFEVPDDDNSKISVMLERVRQNMYKQREKIKLALHDESANLTEMFPKLYTGFRFSDLNWKLPQCKTLRQALDKCAVNEDTAYLKSFQQVQTLLQSVMASSSVKASFYGETFEVYAACDETAADLFTDCLPNDAVLVQCDYSISGISNTLIDVYCKRNEDAPLAGDDRSDYYSEVVEPNNKHILEHFQIMDHMVHSHYGNCICFAMGASRFFITPYFVVKQDFVNGKDTFLPLSELHISLVSSKDVLLKVKRAFDPSKARYDEYYEDYVTSSGNTAIKLEACSVLFECCGCCMKLRASRREDMKRLPELWSQYVSTLQNTGSLPISESITVQRTHTRTSQPLSDVWTLRLDNEDNADALVGNHWNIVVYDNQSGVKEQTALFNRNRQLLSLISECDSTDTPQQILQGLEHYEQMLEEQMIEDLTEAVKLDILVDKSLNECYQYAVSLIEQGGLDSFDEAIQLLEILGDYRDASELKTVVQEKYEKEQDNSEKYNSGIELLAQSAAQKYADTTLIEEAITLFTELGDYRDAAKLLVEAISLLESIRQYQKETERLDQITAKSNSTLIEMEQDIAILEEISRSFDKLSRFRDAEQQKSKTQKLLAQYQQYMKADSMIKRVEEGAVSSKMAENAIQIFDKLGGFFDAAERSKQAALLIKYLDAVETQRRYESEGKNDIASWTYLHSLFDSVGAYRDVTEKKQQIQNHLSDLKRKRAIRILVGCLTVLCLIGFIIYMIMRDGGAS